MRFTPSFRTLSLMTAVGLTLATTGCYRLGFDDEPRTAPKDSRTVLGPKRTPTKNTGGMDPSFEQGALSPEAAMVKEPADAANASQNQNFWNADTGWSATPTDAPMEGEVNTADARIPVNDRNGSEEFEIASAEPMPVAAPEAVQEITPLSQPIDQPSQTGDLSEPPFMASPQQPAQMADAGSSYPELNNTPQAPDYRAPEAIQQDFNEMQGQQDASEQQRQNLMSSDTGETTQPVTPEAAPMAPQSTMQPAISPELAALQQQQADQQAMLSGADASNEMAVEATPAPIQPGLSPELAALRQQQEQQQAMQMASPGPAAAPMPVEEAEPVQLSPELASFRDQQVQDAGAPAPIETPVIPGEGFALTEPSDAGYAPAQMVEAPAPVAGQDEIVLAEVGSDGQMAAPQDTVQLTPPREKMRGDFLPESRYSGYRTTGRY